jgi:predicted protein tyrosine phosphatase
LPQKFVKSPALSGGAAGTACQGDRAFEVTISFGTNSCIDWRAIVFVLSNVHKSAIALPFLNAAPSIDKKQVITELRC